MEGPVVKEFKSGALKFSHCFVSVNIKLEEDKFQEAMDTFQEALKVYL
jgi:hypothetical protein